MKQEENKVQRTGMWEGGGTSYGGRTSRGKGKRAGKLGNRMETVGWHSHWQLIVSISYRKS